MSVAHMQRAIELGRAVRGRTSPNPAVGAVLVREGRVVGQGQTRPAGGAHAEIVALQTAGDLARGATLFVSLEPCCHVGRTPPCTDALIAAGVAEVVYAAGDPNPKVAGGGRQALGAAGIQVRAGLLRAEAEEAHEGFFHWIESGRPFVTAKYAMSLDGRIATHSGDARWITGEPARALVHRERAAADAILTGIGTVLTDNPRLTARGEGALASHQPLRVVVDSCGRLPADAAILTEPGMCLVAVTERAPRDRLKSLERAGAEVVEMPACGERVDLQALLLELGRRGMLSVLVEAGGTLLGSLFDAGLVNKIMAFIAPTLIGGEDAPGPIAGRGSGRIAEAPRLRGQRLHMLGNDLLVMGYLGA